MVETGAKFGVGGASKSKVPFENVIFQRGCMVEGAGVGGEFAGFGEDAFDRGGFLVV